jgi:hypothetical protein
MKAALLAFLLLSCGSVQHCPPHTATVTLNCREAVAKGLKTKEQCYQEIEESCP